MTVIHCSRVFHERILPCPRVDRHMSGCLQMIQGAHKCTVLLSSSPYITDVTPLQPVIGTRLYSVCLQHFTVALHCFWVVM
jgi:hypothetical protein